MDKQCKIQKKKRKSNLSKIYNEFPNQFACVQVELSIVLEQTLSLVSATILDKTISYLQNINLKLI